MSIMSRHSNSLQRSDRKRNHWDRFVFVVKTPHALSSNATTRAMRQDRRPSSPNVEFTLRRSAPVGREALLSPPVFDGIAREYHLRRQVHLFPARSLGCGSRHPREHRLASERGREDVADPLARPRAASSARVRSVTLRKVLSYFTTPHWLPLRQKQTGPSDSLLRPKIVCCLYIRSGSERSGLCTFRMTGSAPAHGLAGRLTKGVGRWGSYPGLS